MKFDLNKILSAFGGKKKRKSSTEDFEDKNEFLDKEEPLEEDDFEEDIFDDEENIETEESGKDNDNKKEKTDNNRKLPIDLKNKKVQLSIAAVTILVVGAVSAPYIMSYIGEQQANNIGSVSNITQPVQMPAPKPRPKPPIHRQTANKNVLPAHGKNNTGSLNGQTAKVHKPNGQIRIRHEQNNANRNPSANRLNIHNTNNIPGSLKPSKIGTQHNVSPENKIAQIEKNIIGTNKKIKEIQNHLVNAKLTGVNDPIGMVDKTIMENRNYDLYLQSQIQLMRKLISYYKQKAELQKTLQLYKMAFNGADAESGAQRQNNSQQEAEKLQKTLKQVVAPLQQQIVMLKQELIKTKRQKQEQKETTSQKQVNADFNQMTKIKLNDLNIFVKNGKYIAVVHTEFGDKIFEEGDYFNGYKIDKILPNMIVFEKNGQKFYYTYNQTLNQKYEVAKIELPGKLSKSEVKDKKKKEGQVKQYKSVSKQQLLQQLLQKRLQQMK